MSDANDARFKVDLRHGGPPSQPIPHLRGTEDDPVRHPSHYTSGKIECIDALESALQGLTGVEAFCTGNAIKYCWRWKRKNGAEDVRKAIWYLNWLKDYLEKQAKAEPIAEPPGKVAACVKCKKTHLAVALNQEGWCKACFDAPSASDVREDRVPE